MSTTAPAARGPRPFINHLCPEFFEAQSAGLEPGQLNPGVVQVMQGAGL